MALECTLLHTQLIIFGLRVWGGGGWDMVEPFPFCLPSSKCRVRVGAMV